MTKKPVRKKIQYKIHEDKLRRQLKLTLGCLVGIPLVVLATVLAYGPELGILIGNLMRGTEPESRREVVVISPIFRNVPTKTNQTEITITGVAEAGNTVILYVNGPEFGEVVSSTDNAFTFDKVELIEGANNIAAKIVDKDGNESKRAEIKIEVDKQAPVLLISSPEHQSTVRNLDGRVRVTGTVDKKATITVNESFAVIKPDLSFEFLLGVEPGEVPISVQAKDEAGNTTTTEITITYVRASN